jgi:hypothetical protein
MYYRFGDWGPNNPVMLLLIVIDLILKGIALWKAARAGQRNWFIALLIISSAGILPALYLYFFQKRQNTSKKTLKKKSF